MYQPKTAGILAALMNVLSLSRSRTSTRKRRTRVLPRRRETVVGRSIPDDAATKEMYFESARLTRWTR